MGSNKSMEKLIMQMPRKGKRKQLDTESRVRRKRMKKKKMGKRMTRLVVMMDIEKVIGGQRRVPLVMSLDSPVHRHRHLAIIEMEFEDPACRLRILLPPYVIYIIEKYTFYSINWTTQTLS